MIIIIALWVILGIAVCLVLLVFGIKLCNKNNALGILLLFLSLNIIGLILGIALVYNSKSKLNQEVVVVNNSEFNT